MTLEEVWHRYSAANREYRRLLVCAPSEKAIDAEISLARARIKESEALAEYLQAIRDLVQFAPGGKLPDGIHGKSDCGDR